jgi:hypothetical protein
MDYAHTSAQNFPNKGEIFAGNKGEEYYYYIE